MKKVEGLIDFSTWTGNWPFIHLKYRHWPDLQEKLAALNVAQAFISPIEGILEQDPKRANTELLKEIEGDFFSPVPIIDLSYADWEDTFQLAAADNRVKIIKLLPNYHMYELDESRLEKLVQLTQQHRLIIAIQIRIEDRRGQYPLLQVDDVDAGTLVKVVSAFPEQTFIFQNLFLPELSQILPAVDHVYVDLASLEHTDVLYTIQQQFTLDRCLFSSHSPFYFPEGNVYKLKYSLIAQDGINKVSHENAKRLLDTTR